MMCHRAARAGREDREAALQAPGQLGRGHRGYPCRRQLDRQRYPIQPPHYFGDRRCVLGGHLESWLDRGRALSEQPHRLRLGGRVQIDARAGHPERWNRNQMFPLDPQAFAAGRQDHQPLTRARQRRGQRRRPFKQVLAVVEHQQQLLGAQEFHQGLAGALPGPGGEGEHRGGRVVYPRRAPNRGQLTQPPAITEPRQHLPGGLQSQPRLPYPSRPGQRHHPRLTQRGPGLLQLPRPADERAHRQRQIPGALRGRADRRKVGREVSVGQLVNELRLGQIAQPELPQPRQAEATAQPPAGQVAGGLGDQHLSTVRGALHPCTPVDRRVVDTVAAGRPRLAGVQPHPYPQRGARRPRRLLQGELARAGRLDRGNRAGKHGEEAVPLPAGGDHHPTMVLDHLD